MTNPLPYGIIIIEREVIKMKELIFERGAELIEWVLENQHNIQEYRHVDFTCDVSITYVKMKDGQEYKIYS